MKWLQNEENKWHHLIDVETGSLINIFLHLSKKYYYDAYSQQID